MIYAISDGSKVKLGYTKTNPARRLAQLQTGSSNTLQIVWLCPDGTRAEEQALHKRFAAQRIRGEWFLSSVLDELAPEYFIGKIEKDSTLSVSGVGSLSDRSQHICKNAAIIPIVITEP